MKKLFSLLLMCFALFTFKANAQSSSLVVTNHTHCDIYYILYGATGPRCLPITGKSNVLFIAAGATVAFPNPTAVPIPGIPPTGLIVGAAIYNKNPTTCADIPLEQHDVYDCCAGAPQSDIVKVYDVFCKLCGTVTIKWGCSKPATLDFY